MIIIQVGIKMGVPAGHGHATGRIYLKASTTYDYRRAYAVYSATNEYLGDLRFYEYDIAKITYSEIGDSEQMARAE